MRFLVLPPPDFQVFWFSPTPATSEILPTGLGRGGERHERQVYAAHNRTFSRGLYKHCLNEKERPNTVIPRKLLYAKTVF
jgi:hypothetical protein